MSDPVWLNLTGLDKVGPKTRSEVIVAIRQALGPLVEAAGRSLTITTGRHRGDLNIDFDSTTPPHPNAGKPNTDGVCGVSLMGEDSGETVFVRAHKDLRVCGPVNPATGKRDTRRVLTASWLLGPALANTAMHELGHFIADLEHVKGSGNFMTIMGPDIDKRTMATQREFWAGKMVFSEDQKRKLVEQLKKKEWKGDSGFTIQGTFQ
jgi:hypothetical protein